MVETGNRRIDSKSDEAIIQEIKRCELGLIAASWVASCMCAVVAAAVMYGALDNKGGGERIPGIVFATLLGAVSLLCYCFAGLFVTHSCWSVCGRSSQQIGLAKTSYQGYDAANIDDEVL